MKTSLVKAALFGDTGPAGETIAGVYGKERLENLRRVTELYPTQVTSANIEQCLPDLADLEVIFSTWGMLVLSSAHLDRLPKLRAVFYAAGSVKYFAPPLLERGITVVSAWAANAMPVAEFTLEQILLANKGYFRNLREYRDTENYLSAFRGGGNYGATVSLLGAGQIGRALIELLRSFRLRVLVFDPFLSHQSAVEMGVQNLTALLDVTDPEPLPRESPLRRLSNVHITSHIAGSIGKEVRRMADTVLEEFAAWSAEQPLRYAVTAQMLATIA